MVEQVEALLAPIGKLRLKFVNLEVEIVLKIYKVLLGSLLTRIFEQDGVHDIVTHLFYSVSVVGFEALER